MRHLILIMVCLKAAFALEEGEDFYLHQGSRAANLQSLPDEIVFTILDQDHFDRQTLLSVAKTSKSLYHQVKRILPEVNEAFGYHPFKDWPLEMRANPLAVFVQNRSMTEALSCFVMFEEARQKGAERQVGKASKTLENALSFLPPQSASYQVFAQAFLCYQGNPLNFGLLLPSLNIIDQESAKLNPLATSLMVLLHPLLLHFENYSCLPDNIVFELNSAFHKAFSAIRFFELKEGGRGYTNSEALSFLLRAVPERHFIYVEPSPLAKARELHLQGILEGFERFKQADKT